MKHKSVLVSAVVLVVMIVIASVSAFAAQYDFTLQTNMVWHNGVSALHETAYYHCATKLHAVWPIDPNATDTYHRVQCRILDGNDELAMNSYYIVLNENVSGITPIQIKNGHNLSLMVFQYRGNTNAAANATISVWGTMDISTGQTW